MVCIPELVSTRPAKQIWFYAGGVFGMNMKNGMEESQVRLSLSLSLSLSTRPCCKEASVNECPYPYIHAHVVRRPVSTCVPITMHTPML
jgi:hypothetical protein